MKKFVRFAPILVVFIAGVNANDMLDGTAQTEHFEFEVPEAANTWRRACIINEQINVYQKNPRMPIQYIH